MAGKPMPFLPKPECAVDETVMEVEDGIESSRVVFAHAAVKWLRIEHALDAESGDGRRIA